MEDISLSVVAKSKYECLEVKIPYAQLVLLRGCDWDGSHMVAMNYSDDLYNFLSSIRTGNVVSKIRLVSDEVCTYQICSHRRYNKDMGSVMLLNSVSVYNKDSVRHLLNRNYAHNRISYVAPSVLNIETDQVIGMYLSMVHAKK